MRLLYNRTGGVVSAAEEGTMTEEQWFASTDAAQLIRACPKKIAPRKLRLFMADWFRLNWDTVRVPAVREAVELAERYVDGIASKKQLERMYDVLRDTRGWGATDSLLVVWPGDDQMAEAAIQFAQMLRAAQYVPWAMDELKVEYKARMALLANFLRDIVGNPFQPVAFDPAWRTDAAVTLAKGMYDSRDFGAMPILADALQDAGCTNDDILNHCRDVQQAHVRGCWVVDLVLGKA
jgi:hypothetical protein